MKHSCSKMFGLRFTLPLVLLIISQLSLKAQYPGVPDLSFPLENGPRGTVHAIHEEIDGRILVGGSFNQVGQSEISSLARFTKEGQIDLDFQVPLDGNVLDVDQDDEGSIWIVGDFLNVGEQSARRIARLKSNGQLDESFHSGNGFDGTVYSVEPLADGRVLVGGSFNHYNGQAAPSLIMLNSDGSVDTRFQIGAGVNGVVYDILQLNNSGFIIGGVFQQFDSKPCANIARITTSGRLNEVFSRRTESIGTLSRIRTLALNSDGDVFAGGFINPTSGGSLDVESEDARLIVKLSTSGVIDTEFAGPIVSSGTGEIFSITFDHQGNILVGGNFSESNNRDTLPKNAYALLSSDGNLDEGFNPTWGSLIEPFGVDVSSVNAVLTHSSGELFLGGFFRTQSDSNELSGIGLLKLEQGLVELLAPSIFSPSILTLQKTEGESAILTVSGWGNPYPDFQWMRDGQPVFTDQEGPSLRMSNLRSQDGGDYQLIAENTQGRIEIPFKLNVESREVQPGELDLGFNKNWNQTGNIEQILPLPNDQFLIAGSNFGIRPGSESSIPWYRQSVFRCNPDGSIDPSFKLFNGNIGHPQVSPQNIRSMVLDRGHHFMLGGRFTITQYNSDQQASMNHLARFSLNGALDTTFNLGAGPDGDVDVIAPLVDGNLWIAGRFQNFNGLSSPYVALLDQDGNPVESFNVQEGFNARVTKGYADEQGRLVVIGFFESYQGTEINGIARILQDGSLDTTFVMQNGIDEKPEGIIQGSNGEVFIYGSFTQFKGVPASHIVKLDDQGELVESFKISNQIEIVDIKNIVMGETGHLLFVEASVRNNSGNIELRLLRLDAETGNLDEDFLETMQPFSGLATSLEIQPGLGLLMQGDFRVVNGVSRDGLARIFTNDFERSRPVLRQPIISESVKNGFGLNVFTSVHANPPATFQWFFNGLPIHGEVSSSLQRRFANSSHQGSYHLQISNDEGDLITDSVHISIERGNPGSIDHDFIPQLILRDAQVNSILEQENQSVLIAGSLNPRGGLPGGDALPNMVRFLSDGSLDPTFNQGEGPDGVVNCVLELPWGDLLIGGSFQKYNQSDASGYVVTDKNGHLRENDEAPLSRVLMLTLSNLEVLQVSTATLDEEGGIYLGAQFGSGRTRRIIRLNPDASQDLGFSPIEQDIGKFKNLHWQPDRTLWAYHDHGMMWHFDEVGRVLQETADFEVEGLRRGLVRFGHQSNGHTIILGKLPRVNDTRLVEKWVPDSGLDLEFPLFEPVSASGWAHGLAVTSDDFIYVGSKPGDTADSGLVRLHPNGSLDTRFSSDRHISSVDHLAVLENGDLFVVGDFSRSHTGFEGKIARVFGMAPEFSQGVQFGITLNESNLEISYTSEPDQKYQLLTRTSLVEGAWEILMEQTASDLKSTFMVQQRNQPQVFFQVRKVGE